jgi:hypothetical protein
MPVPKQVRIFLEDVIAAHCFRLILVELDGAEESDPDRRCIHGTGWLTIRRNKRLSFVESSPEGR